MHLSSEEGGTDEAKMVGRKTMDACEYLMALHREGKLDTAFTENVPARINYHAPCHLRAQNIGPKSAQLLRLLPGTKVRVVEECSGVDGTWGMKATNYDAGLEVARKLLKKIEEEEAEILSTDCPLAGLRIEQHTGRRPLHPVEILCASYGD